MGDGVRSIDIFPMKILSRNDEYSNTATEAKRFDAIEMKRLDAFYGPPKLARNIREILAGSRCKC